MPIKSIADAYQQTGFLPRTAIVFVTVLPAKSDSGIMFCSQSYQDLELIDNLCINPICRIGFIHG